MLFTKALANNAPDILALLWQHDGLTCRDLCDRAGLSRPTVERALQSLVDNQLVAADSELSPGRGRPAKRFRIRADAWRTLGMDFELPEVNVVMSDALGAVIHQTGFEFRERLENPRAVLDRLVVTLLDWMGGLPSDVSSAAGLGIGVPGFLTPHGVSFVGRNLPAWEHVPVREHLEERLRMPVLIRHDVHLMALAEIEQGRSPEGLSLFISVRPGLNDDLRIGAAICADGRVFAGGHGNGGALYQAVVDSDSISNADNETRVQSIAERLVLSLTHAIPLIDPERVIIHAECLGALEPELISSCRESLELAMQGEYIGMADITQSTIRGASGAQQAALAVTRQMLTQLAPGQRAGARDEEGERASRHSTRQSDLRDKRFDEGLRYL